MGRHIDFRYLPSQSASIQVLGLFKSSGYKMILMGDRVPMFKLRPYRGLLLFAFLVFVIGGLLSAYFFVEDNYLTGYHRGLFTLLVTLLLTFLLVIVAFSRYGFRHLWHHRPGYKRG